MLKKKSKDIKQAAIEESNNTIEINRGTVIKAYEFLLGRLPESEDVVQYHTNNTGTIENLINMITASEEFRHRYKMNLEMDDLDICKKAKKIMPFVSALDTHGYRWLFNSKDTVISDYMFWNRDKSFQKDDIDLFFLLSEKYYYGSGLEKGIFLDIGGNIGTTAIPVKKEKDYVTKVIAFEPSAENCRIFSANCVINDLKLGEDVIVNNIGLSNKNVKAKLTLSDNNMGDHRVCLNNNIADENHNYEQIELNTLENYFENCEDKFGDVKYIWIDTQGHEGFVLDGAKQLLLKSNVPLLIEFWPDEMRRVGGLELLIDTLKEVYTNFIDIGKYQSGGVVRPIEDLNMLANEYTNFTFTDIFLIK